MNFPNGLFSTEWQTVGGLLLLPIVAWSLRTAPWRRLADARTLNAWLAAIVALTLMWHMNAGVRPGLNLHLLGATLMTLMFGRQFAIAGLCVVLALTTFNGTPATLGWWAYPLNALGMIVLPVFLAWAIWRMVERVLPHNLFIYIFVAGFLGAALNTLFCSLAATLLLGAANVYPMAWLFGEFLLFCVLLAFAEAWLTGAVIALLVVYCPQHVATFDDQRYLRIQ